MVAKVQATTLPCSDRSSAADDSEQDDHNGNHQQNVDETAQGLWTHGQQKHQRHVRDLE